MKEKSQEVTRGGKKRPDTVELAQDLPVFLPATDIYEKEDSVLVVCDLPGVSDKDVDISLEDDVLTITARQDVKEPEGYGLLHRGYRSGIFRRSFTLTTEIDSEKIKAKISNGVLKLDLPKSEKVRPKRIEVTAG